MHSAIVHIGTEKTGSTAVQNLLYENHAALESAGIFFPFKQCGLISNHRLVVYARSTPDRDLCRMNKELRDKPVQDAGFLDAWKSKFANQHERAVRKFQRGRKTSLVVYSSEHFHSRLLSQEDVSGFARYLDGLYDKVTIVGYLRRQDHLACSAWNTAIQGGATRWLDFSGISPKIPYYDYLSLAKRWAQAFGRDSLQLRVFDKTQLRGGDVVEDFKHYLPLPEHLRAPGALIKRRSNPRLSSTALALLRLFNTLPEDDALLAERTSPICRQALIRRLHETTDLLGQVMPSQRQASALLSRFAHDNEQLHRDWLTAGAFDDSVSMYPVHELTEPEGDFRAQLATVLDSVSPSTIGV